MDRESTMSHFDEMAFLLYLDGQLDSLKAKELELHVRSCTPCRALLAALQRESALLHQAMAEEEEPVPAGLLSPPEQERVPWGWIVSLGLAAMGGFTLWSQVAEWQDQLSKLGFGGGNLLAMLFFSGVFWKGWEEMTLVLQLFAAATLGAPLVFLLWRKRRRLKPVALVLCALAGLLAWPGTATAKVVKGEEPFTVKSGETLKEDLIAMGPKVRVEGAVEGDVFLFCQSATITGRVTGDVIAFAEELRVEGEVDGDIRGAVKTLLLRGTVTRSITMFAQDIRLEPGSMVKGSLMAFGKTADLEGKIARDVMAFGERVNVEGSVGGNFQMTGEHLSIGSGAEIQGSAKYRGRKEPEVAAGAKLAQALQIERRVRKSEYARPGFYWGQALKWGVGFIYGLVVILLLPNFYRDVMRSSRRYGPALGFGVISVIGTPVFAVVACLTVVGLAVGIGTLLLWIIALYSCKIVVGTWLGERLLGEAPDTSSLIGRMALGTLVLRVLAELPYYIGPLVVVGFVALGFGAITLAVYDRLTRSPEAPAPAGGVGTPAPALQL